MRTRQSRFSQAAELLASTVEPASRVFGDTDKDVMSLRLELANLLFEGGDHRNAAPQYQRLAADLAERDGVDDELVLHCRHKEATCHALVGDAGHALRLLDALLVDESRVFGAEDPRTIELRRQIALLQLGAGERDAARETLTRLLADLSRLHGPGHPSVAEIQELLGRVNRPAVEPRTSP
jgi:hypothetical protein